MAVFAQAAAPMAWLAVAIAFAGLVLLAGPAGLSGGPLPRPVMT
ncbi:hypothetical protein [Duganella sp. FT27W]|nr:hypothetical protein [Duganella sp. FT27W]